MSELPQGSVIGILGGGQLGRMLSVAARTSAAVTPGPLRLLFRMKAISASARGAISALASISIWKASRRRTASMRSRARAHGTMLWLCST